MIDLLLYILQLLIVFIVPIIQAVAAALIADWLKERKATTYEGKHFKPRK